MKTKILSLFVVVMFCMANIALAASNPFDDVPINHWAYTAVNQLAKAGIIDGYDNGNFQGDKALTRYEMAQIVGKAISHQAKADAENKALIKKLAVEFKDELTNLGVRVEKLEKKSDKVTFNGNFHISDQIWRNTGVYNYQGAGVPNNESSHANDGQWWSVGIDLYATYKINDNWKVLIEDEAVRDFQSGNYAVNFNPTADKDASVLSGMHNDQMFATGKIGALDTKIGKFEYQPGYGIVLRQDQKAVMGAQVAFGAPNQVKTILTYGYLRRIWGGNNAENPYIISNTSDNRYAAAEINVPLAKDANFKAAYHKISNLDGISGNYSTIAPFSSDINFWEVGADKMIAKNLKLFATYSKSNADEDNKAYLAGLTYGRMDLNKPGSYGVTARYVHWEKYTGIGHGYWASGFTHGIKGPELFANVVLDKNVAMFAWCDWVKPTDGTSGSINTVKMELDFFF